MKRLIPLLLTTLTSSCFTIEKDAQTAEGQLIPGKRFLDFMESEFVCEPTHGKNHRELESLLDRYGKRGWKLGGFINRAGETTAFCMQR